MEYIKGEILQNILRNFPTTDPIKVEVALGKIVTAVNDLESKYKSDLPAFVAAKAATLVCGPINNVHFKFDDKYLSILKDQKENFKTKLNNFVIDAFNPKYMDHYSKNDLQHN